MGNFAFCFRLRIFYVFKSTLFENSFSNTIKVSNSLDPDQARQSVGSDQGLNCLQRLIADDTSRQTIHGKNWPCFTIIIDI